ncbi:MAG: hypothetical protein ABEJ77_00045 [Halanaeroarchaeum sp.]
MPFKERGTTGEGRVVDRWEDGLGWIAHPEETMQRTSHALVAGDGVWIVDPLWARGIAEEIADLGSVAGVVVLLDRHQRDADRFAAEFDVPIYRPPFVNRDFDAPTEILGVRLPDTDVKVIHTVDLPGWQEAALYDGETLIVADALGTVEYFTVGAERIGVHPLLRLVPPTVLRDATPSRILVGHGEGLDEDPESALVHAIDGARSRLPRAWLSALRSLA